MYKVIQFVGSPRSDGFSTSLSNQVAGGAKSVGANIISYHLNDPGIKGCQGCFYCRSHNGCATKDALSPMYEDIKDADGIIVSFPLYFGNINGQTKTWLDRMYPMLDGAFKPRHPGKKIVTIFSQGNGNPDFMKDITQKTNSFFKMFGWDLVKSFLVVDTHNPDCAISESMMKDAFEAGKLLCSE